METIKRKKKIQKTTKIQFITTVKTFPEDNMYSQHGKMVS